MESSLTTVHLEYCSARQRAAQICRLRELHREYVAHARVLRPGTASDGVFESVPRAAAAVLVGDFNFAGRMRDVRVDKSTDASDHQSMPLELA